MAEQRKPYYDIGRYWGRLKNHPIGQAKTGTPQVVLTFEIVGKVNPMEPDGDLLHCPPGHGTMFLSLTKDTIDWVLPILRTLGLIGDKVSVLDPSMPDHQSLVGKEIGLFCNHKVGQDGVLRESWGLARDGGGPKVESLGQSDLRKLDAMFGRQLKATATVSKEKPKSNGKKPEATTDYSEPVRTEPDFTEEELAQQADDIPF